MFLKQDMNVIIVIVNRGFADKVLEAAKSAGAEGATMFNARGNGIHETDTILGVSIQPEKEVVMIVVRKNIRKKVMRAICVDCGMNEEGRGLCFSMPIEEIGGVNHLMDLVGGKKRVVSKPVAKSNQTQSNKTENKESKTADKTQDKPTEKSSDKTQENPEEKIEEKSIKNTKN